MRFWGVGFVRGDEKTVLRRDNIYSADKSEGFVNVDHCYGQ